MKIFIGICKDRFQISKWYPVLDRLRYALRKAELWGGGHEQTGARIN